ncbi:MAG TPA: type II toxin-antitoxin system RelE/ParE family toxin [Rhizomicrobium sp.]|nr:type II toxin-antitoxin system RelE/ParE family toxin [Rhizomicrobium sp.]
MRQIDEIHEYIARDSANSAQDVADRIQKIIDLVTENPRIGRMTRERGVCSYPVTPYPYVVFYRYNERLDEVRILRVRHAAMRRAGLQDEASEFRVAAAMS